MSDLVAAPGLRYWRLQCTLTQKELAQVSGVGRATIARLEAGRSSRAQAVGTLNESLTRLWGGRRPIDIRRKLNARQRAHDNQEGRHLPQRERRWLVTYTVRSQSRIWAATAEDAVTELHALWGAGRTDIQVVDVTAV